MSTKSGCSGTIITTLVIIFLVIWVLAFIATGTIDTSDTYYQSKKEDNLRRIGDFRNVLVPDGVELNQFGEPICDVYIDKSNKTIYYCKPGEDGVFKIDLQTDNISEITIPVSFDNARITADDNFVYIVTDQRSVHKVPKSHNKVVNSFTSKKRIFYEDIFMADDSIIFIKKGDSRLFFRRQGTVINKHSFEVREEKLERSIYFDQIDVYKNKLVYSYEHQDIYVRNTDDLSLEWEYAFEKGFLYSHNNLFYKDRIFLTIGYRPMAFDYETGEYSVLSGVDGGFGHADENYIYRTTKEGIAACRAKQDKLIMEWETAIDRDSMSLLSDRNLYCFSMFGIYEDCTVTKIDPVTGHIQWENNIGKARRLEKITEYDSIAVAEFETEELYIIDNNNGELLWRDFNSSTSFSLRWEIIDNYLIVFTDDLSIMKYDLDSIGTDGDDNE